MHSETERIKKKKTNEKEKKKTLENKVVKRSTSNGTICEMDIIDI